VSVHVLPRGDTVVQHVTEEDCVCGPTPEPVELTGGAVAWLFTHHSLDGREKFEGRP
jgi:hypothetical protein